MKRKTPTKVLLVDTKIDVPMQPSVTGGLPQLVGQSPVFLALTKELHVIAKTDVTVLLTGETGTGKDVCARLIHQLSSRSREPFVALNCGAIPVTLIENELFGHETGAYTGALRNALGAIRGAEGGTLFLAVIDSWPWEAQSKLLRLLEDKHIRPLGSTKTQFADVRIIAASNANLEEAVRSGRFRKDLYYRLTLFPLHLPPLRERPGDVSILARHFLEQFASTYAKSGAAFAPAALSKLERYDWPGNVRELENVVHRAIILSDHAELREQDLILADTSSNPRTGSYRDQQTQRIDNFGKAYFANLLRDHDGNISGAAKSAKMDRHSLRIKLQEHGLYVLPVLDPKRPGRSTPPWGELPHPG